MDKAIIGPYLQPFDHNDWMDWQNCGKFSDGTLPHRYYVPANSELFDVAVIASGKTPDDSPAAVLVHITRFEDDDEDSDAASQTYIDVVIPMGENAIKEIFFIANSIIKEIDNVSSLEEVLNYLEGLTYVYEVYFDGPLGYNTGDFTNFKKKDWKVFKQKLLSNFQLTVDGNEDKFFNTKNEVTEFIADLFNNDSADEVVVKNRNNFKVVTLHSEDI